LVKIRRIRIVSRQAVESKEDPKPPRFCPENMDGGRDGDTVP
jgi:hypothetical protein